MESHTDMRWKSRLGPPALCILAHLAAGCGTLYTRADPSTGVGFMLGELQAPVNAPPEQVAAAIDRAFAELGIEKRYQAPPGYDVEVVGFTPAKEKVRVLVKRSVSNKSYVHIRAGTIGDEQLSRTIYEKIKACLPSAGLSPLDHPMMKLPPLPGGASAP